MVNKHFFKTLLRFTFILGIGLLALVVINHYVLKDQALSGIVK